MEALFIACEQELENPALSHTATMFGPRTGPGVARHVEGGGNTLSAEDTIMSCLDLYKLVEFMQAIIDAFENPYMQEQ